MIYLDHNATNLVDPRVLEVYRLALREGWANPSSPHGPGRRARALLETAREQVAALTGVAPGQVTFTASGTEALNQAIRTLAPQGRVTASAVEHSAVLSPLNELSQAGQSDVELVPVDASGVLQLGAWRARLPESTLAALLAAQNEVGTLQPLAEAGAACLEAKVPLLVDATQAVGRVARDWSQQPWDYLVLSGHKMRAPRGAAALVHRGLAPPPRPLILGGPQELGRRAGTESVAAAAALGEACRLAQAGALCDPEALQVERDWLEGALRQRIPGVEILAADVARLPQTVMALVPNADGEALLAGLDLAGVAASSGSACASGALERSHVLEAMGVSPERARGRIRLSFGPETSRAELESAVDLLVNLVAGAPPQG